MSFVKFLVVAVTAYGVVLRLVHPGHAFYWNDEVWTALQATGHAFSDVHQFVRSVYASTAADFVAFQRYDPAAPLGIFLRRDPHSSPLFYLLCSGAIRLAHNHVLGTRLLAASFGCLALVAIHLTARELWQSKVAAWTASAFAAVSPIQLAMSYEARPYTLWLATMALSTHAFLRAHRSNQRRLWILYALFTALMLYSHLYGAFTILAHVVYALVSSRTTRASWLSLAGALTFDVLVCVPWLVSISHHLDKVAKLTKWMSQPQPWRETLQGLEAGALWQFATFESVRYVPFGQYVLVALVPVVCVVALTRLWRHAPREVAAMITVLLGALPLYSLMMDLMVGGRRFGIMRYYVTTWLGITLLISWSVMHELECMSADRRRRVLAAGWLLTCAVLGVSAVHGAWSSFVDRSPVGKPDEFAPAIVEEIRRARDPVILNPSLVTMPLILSNDLPPDTPILNLTELVLPERLAEIRQLLMSRPVLLLRPLPDRNEAEPRLIEATHLTRRLGSMFWLQDSSTSCCLARLSASRGDG